MNIDKLRLHLSSQLELPAEFTLVYPEGDFLNIHTLYDADARKFAEFLYLNAASGYLERLIYWLMVSAGTTGGDLFTHAQDRDIVEGEHLKDFRFRSG